MARFVLVHTAYFGGWAWRFVTSRLRDAGHDVWAPTLTGLGERAHLAHPGIDLDTHIEDVVNMLRYEDLDQVVLVGWSYGGMVTTGVADRVPELLNRLVYLDAEVPRDGESTFDLNGQEYRAEAEEMVRTSGDGWQVPLGSDEEVEELFKVWFPDPGTRRWVRSKLVSQPVETYRQPARLSNPAAEVLPRSLVRWPRDGEAFAPTYEPIAERIRADPRWEYHEVDTNHFAPLVAPELVTDLLLERAGVGA
jgi:pimeloyl-ACP methyl ester carboxylesterase